MGLSEEVTFELRPEGHGASQCGLNGGKHGLGRWGVSTTPQRGPGLLGASNRKEAEGPGQQRAMAHARLCGQGQGCGFLFVCFSEMNRVWGRYCMGRMLTSTLKGDGSHGRALSRARSGSDVSYLWLCVGDRLGGGQVGTRSSGSEGRQ